MKRYHADSDMTTISPITGNNPKHTLLHAVQGIQHTGPYCRHYRRAHHIAHLMVHAIHVLGIGV